MPRVADCSGTSDATYRMHVSNEQDGSTSEWARYIRELTSREGWTVARLAREARLDRGTLFRWMREGGGEAVTVENVCRIADAAGDERYIALRAAAGLSWNGDEGDLDEAEFEIRMLQQADFPDEQKAEMVKFARQLQQRQLADRVALRARQLTDRRAAIQAAMDIARGGGTQPAT
jgi:transcriptional regulator with XRE-family HTH domain